MSDPIVNRICFDCSEILPWTCSHEADPAVPRNHVLVLAAPTVPRAVGENGGKISPLAPMEISVTDFKAKPMCLACEKRSSYGKASSLHTRCLEPTGGRDRCSSPAVSFPPGCFSYCAQACWPFCVRSLAETQTACWRCVGSAAEVRFTVNALCVRYVRVLCARAAASLATSNKDATSSR